MPVPARYNFHKIRPDLHGLTGIKLLSKKAGVPPAALLFVIIFASILLLTLLLFAVSKLLRQSKKRRLHHRMRSPTISSSESPAAMSHRSRRDVWPTLPNTSQLSENESKELLKLNPSFNRHILIPDPPFLAPPSPIFSSPALSNSSHNSFSPLLPSTRAPSPSSSLAPSLPSKPELMLANQPAGSRSSPLSFEHSPDMPTAGLPMTGDWQGGFKAVPVERAIYMNMERSLEDAGINRVKEIRNFAENLKKERQEKVAGCSANPQPGY